MGFLWAAVSLVAFLAAIIADMVMVPAMLAYPDSAVHFTPRVERISRIISPICFSSPLDLFLNISIKSFCCSSVRINLSSGITMILAIFTPPLSKHFCFFGNSSGMLLEVIASTASTMAIVLCALKIIPKQLTPVLDKIRPGCLSIPLRFQVQGEGIDFPVS